MSHTERLIKIIKLIMILEWLKFRKNPFSVSSFMEFTNACVRWEIKLISLQFKLRTQKTLKNENQKNCAT